MNRLYFENKKELDCRWVRQNQVPVLNLHFSLLVNPPTPLGWDRTPVKTQEIDPTYWEISKIQIKEKLEPV